MTRFRLIIPSAMAFCAVLIGISSGQVRALPSSCPVEFKLDASHAALLLEILKDNRVTEDEMNRFLAHPGSDDVIQKTRSYGLDVTKKHLAFQIRQLTTSEEISDRTFGLVRYNARRENTAKLIDKLQKNLDSLMADICGMIAPYVPPGKQFSQKFFLLSAVNSTGFTFDDPNRFYLVAEAFNGDLGGASDVIVHESYHAVQSALLSGNRYFTEDPGLAPEHNKAMRLLAGVILEGTATHVADPIAAGRDGAMRLFHYNSARRYLRDPKQIFVLFDTAVFRAFYDPDVDYYQLHKIGLEGNEAFYHLGALMARVIVDADGPGSIPAYFSRSPVAFFDRYIKLADAIGSELPTFSVSTRSILKQLEQVK